jgi:hypothetical protein
MLLLLLVLTSVALVPLGGGRPHPVAELRLRRVWLLLFAIALQAALVLAPGEVNLVRIGAYIGSYLAAGGFLLANRHVPGLWMIGLGAAMNFSAILANGGVMPAAPHAIATAGLAAHPGVFSNSIPLDAPRLALLGDIFAIPASWPFSNVFSLGDACIVIGAVVTVHRTTGSRLIPSGSGRFTELARDRGFLFTAAGHALSSLGGWTLAAALVYRLAHEAAGIEELARGAAILLGVGLLLHAVCAEFLARSGIRDPRRAMVAAEGLRVLAIVSLASPAAPSLLHLALVAGCLGASAPPIRLCTTGSRSPEAPPERRMAETATLLGITGLAVVAAPPLVSTLVAASGPGLIPALGVAPVAAALLFSRRRSPEAETGSSPSGAASSVFKPQVLVLLVLGASLGLAAALPLQPELPGPLLSGVTQVPRELLALEFVAGVWGMGMILGAIAAPALASRVRPERLLATAVAGMGILVLAAGTESFSALLFAWLLAGVALAVAGVSARSICDQASGGDRVRAEARLQAAATAGLLLGGSAAALLAVGLTTLLGVAAAVLLGTALAANRFLAAPADRENAPEDFRDSLTR